MLDCAFDLFRFAIAWLGGEPESGRRESDNWVDLSDRPRSHKLPTRFVSFSYSLTQRKHGFCSSRLPQKGTFLLPSSYPLIIVDDACRPALPSSAPLLRPVSCQSPRSSPHSRSGSQSSFLLRRKRYARVIRAGNSLLRWHPNVVIDVTVSCRSRRRALSMVKSLSAPSSSTNSMGMPYRPLCSFLSDL